MKLRRRFRSDSGSQSLSDSKSPKAFSRRKKKTRTRRSRMEQLESRQMLAAAVWHNVLFTPDVNRSGHASPLDALFVINELARNDYSDPITGDLVTEVPVDSERPFYDVNCDQKATPRDALYVLNYLAGLGFEPNFALTTSDSITGSQGNVTALGCSAQLNEGDSLRTEITAEMTLSEQSDGLRVLFDAPQFDQTSSGRLRDAFEISLSDENGNLITQPYAPGRTSTFNWSEGTVSSIGTAATLMPPSESGDPYELTVNLAHLEAGSTVRLTARLINNDGDSNSSVVIRDIELATNLSEPSQVYASSSSAVQRAAQLVDVQSLEDISGSVVAEYGSTSYTEDGAQLISELTVTNRGNQTVVGDLIVVLDQFTDLDSAVMRPDGLLPDGRPYINMTGYFDGALQPGQSTQPRELRFANPGDDQFEYRLQTLGDLNQAPERFTTTPIAQLSAGDILRYKAAASDPDGDELTYSMVSGSEYVIIDDMTGQITWQSTTAELGNNRFTIRATDPYGLFVDQTFDLQVVESLQNRPPSFVSKPVTEAIASSGFEITTVGVGASPAGAAIISGFQGPRIVAANAADQTIGVYAGENNDRFDETTEYATGFPTSDGQWFDVGYSIDAGLPEYVGPSDSNEVRGIDQGDINGDGNLDFVVMSTYDIRSEPSQQYQLIITALVGDGNGNFAAPVEIYRHSNGTSTFDVRNLLLRDLNGDGALDVIAAERQRDPRLITILGNGNGTFQPAVEQRFAGSPLSDFRAADIDEDGNLDLIGRLGTLAGGYQYEAVWLRGQGDGTFAAPIVIGPMSFSFDLNLQTRPYDVLDLNGDDNLDFVFTDFGNLKIYHSDGNGNFTLATEFNYPLAQQIDWIRGGDFNGDGIADLLHDDTNNGFELLIGSGDGINFTQQSGVRFSDRVGNYAGSDDPVDIDGDGDLELFLGDGFGFQNSQVSPRIAFNDGSGNFTINEYAMVDFSTLDEVDRFDSVYKPRGGMFGDYNSDGVLDFSYFTQSSDFDGVGIRLGTRPGEFGSSRSLPWVQGTRAQDATPGDFNGDGYIDLIDTFNDRISLALGDGTYSDPVPAVGISVPSGYGSVADFNLDGFDDIVATRANTNGSRYYVALANGNGTFTVSDEQLVESSFYGYSSTLISDFNGDGYPDFVAKAGVETHIDVHLNDPTNPGVFSRTFRITLPPASQGVNVSNWQESYAAADFTGDGVIDLAFAERDADSDNLIKVVVMAGDGLGDFTRHSELAGFDEGLPIAGNFYEPGDFSAGDLDSDGDIDLVSVTSYGPRVFLNDGTGNFQFLTHLTHPGAQQRGRDSWLIDFDDDGNLDLIQTGNNGFGPLVFRPGNGDGTFKPGQQVGLSGSVPSGISRNPFADLDGDGHLDFVHAGAGIGNSISYTFSVYAQRRDDTVDMLAVDLDGDGNEEVLAVNDQMDRLQIYQGDNLGGLTRLPDLQTGRSPKAVAVGDLDGDGQLEIFVANQAGKSISVFSGNLADGYVATEVAVAGRVNDLASMDINGDGNDDLVASDIERNGLLRFISDGSKILATPTEIALGDIPGRLTLADANGNQTIDAIVTLPDSNRLMILDDIAAAAVSAPIYIQLESRPEEAGVLELNSDGNPDIAITLPDSDTLTVLYGLGNNQFASPQNISVGERPERLTVADADEDGRLDLIVANAGDNTASVIYNRFDPNEVYRYDSDAIDPDDDAIHYSIVDGPGGLIINNETGELLWAASPDQVGTHDVTLAADDGRGGVATQSFKIEVEPARENSPPLIASTPVQRIGAGETFRYQAQSIDNDRDAIRYRILSGPEGAEINPVTGLLQWDGRVDGAAFISPKGTNPNFSGVNFGDLITPVGEDSSLSLKTLTAEGWFNFENLTASNGAATLFRFGSSQTEQFHIRVRFNSELELYLDQEDTTSQAVSRVPFDVEIGRWFHVALSVDDANRTFNFLINGESIVSGDLPGSFVYDVNTQLEIGGAFWDFSGRVDNFRIWDTARTAEQIKEGLSRHYDGDPNVVLDYRFEDEDARLVRDRSGNNNDGFLVSNLAAPVITPDGLAEPGSHTFVIAVEDGRGGSDEQSFTLEVLPELRGSITGRVFDDINGDGDRDDGSETGVAEEPWLENWHLFIDTNGNAFPDPHEPQTTTDAEGRYEFAGLLPGDYPIKVTPVAGYATPSEFTATVEPETIVASIPASVTDYDLAIEQLSLSQIRGRLATVNGDAVSYWKVYADLDGDAQRGEDEPMAMSDRFGNYALSGLNSGSYKLLVDTPAGWIDAAEVDGLMVTLGTDEINSGNDFVLAPTNTSVAAGLHFVTEASTTIEARQTYTYASVAFAISQADVAYDLSLAPEGMVIDPSTGLVAWRPTINQVGEHTVIVRATSGDSIALQDFVVNVTAPNFAPVVTRLPSPTAYLNTPHQFDIAAQDPEQHPLSFAFVGESHGATVNATSGRLTWTPTANGSFEFTLRVTDSQGDSVDEVFTINVTDVVPAADLVDLSLPRDNYPVGTQSIGRIAAMDSLGRDVDWRLDNAPTGMTVNSDGTIEWTPGNSQLGVHDLTFIAVMADGNEVKVDVSISVVGSLVNSAPVIDSTPIVAAVVDQQYAYDIVAIDSDRDPLSFALLQSPAGMSIDPLRGTIRWTPADDQLGEAEVIVRLADTFGAEITQTFTVTARRFGGPPILSSVPPTEAAVGLAYFYSVQADDAERDPLRYRLLDGPDGMTISEGSGEIVWTPAVNQTGLQTVVIEVADGVGGAATQAFPILVRAGAPNLPPVIDSSAPKFSAVGTAYEYQIDANDPESSALSYQISVGPNDMAVDSQGKVTWTPEAGVEGKIPVTIRVIDLDGAASIESFEIDVLAQNIAPVIDSSAPTEATAGAVYRYDVLASDANVDLLTYELTQAPGTASIDPFGRIRWVPDINQIGDHNFEVTVRDPRGGSTQELFTVSVVEDTEAPKVSLIERPNDASRNVLPWQGPFVVYAKAIDNVEVVSLTLSANGQDIPLDAAGTATFTFQDWAFTTITATATATDTNGNVATRTITFNYDFPEGWSGAGAEDIPTAEITSPTEAAAVFGMVSISGTADHSDFAAYRLSYRRIDETQFTEFVRSETPVNNGELGVWDTSLLPNDEYVIRLEVATTGGVANVVERHIGLAGELKIGTFNIAFTDLEVAVAGIPIHITRVYDSLHANEKGDFGFGWRLEFRNTDLRVGLPKSGLEDIGIYSALRPGVKVYLNVPGQGRQGFTFDPDIRVLPGWGGNNLVLARPRFTPDPGVTSTLWTGTSSYLQVNEQGELFAPGGIPYNPASPDFGGAYVLTTQDGFQYRIEGDTGKLTTATDRNGNRILFTDAGIIQESSNLQVNFLRDAEERIIAVEDLVGNVVRYSYDGSGRLDKFVDRELNETSFIYSAQNPNLLTNIIDPLGRNGTRTEYDADGRLIRITQNDGNSFDFDYELNSDIQRVRDPLGNTTTYVYDNRGNVLSAIDPLGNETKRTYDTNGYIASMKDPLGNMTRFTNDAYGNVLRKTDATGAVTQYAYNDQSQLLRSIDSLGHVMTNERDSNGNLVAAYDSTGPLVTRSYDSQGNVLTTTDATGNTETFVYDNGLPVMITDPNGHVTNYTIDASRNYVREESVIQTAKGATTRYFEYVYDKNGTLTGIENSGGSQSVANYDSAGQISSIQTLTGATTELAYDGLGRVSELNGSNGESVVYQHDALGRVVRAEYTNGTVVQREYDAAGRQISETIDGVASTRTYDNAGRVTSISDDGSTVQFSYDAVGRITREYYNDGSAVIYQYDSEGRQTSVSVEGLIQRFRYDGRGQLIGQESDAGGVSREYDAAGRLIRTTDELQRTWQYRYNAIGILQQVIDPEGRLSQIGSDNTGTITSVTDSLGRTTNVVYNELDQLESRSLPLGQTETYQYDEAGLPVSRTTFSGDIFQMQYDAFGRLVELRDALGNVIRSYDYQPDQLIIQLPGGTETRIENADGSLTVTDSYGQVLRSKSVAGESAETHTGERTTLIDGDDAGLPEKLTDFTGGTVTYEYSPTETTLVQMTFDSGASLSRNAVNSDFLNEIVFTDSTDTTLDSIAYDRDDLGRILSVQLLGGVSTEYEYGLLGELLSETIDDGTSQVTRRYSFDQVGNLIEVSDESGIRQMQYDANDRLIADGEWAVQYDDDGNLIRRTNATTTEEYTYDGERRLLQFQRTVDGNVTDLIEFTYNASGLPIKRLHNGQEQGFVWDDNTFAIPYLVEVRDDTNSLIRRYDFDGTRYVQIHEADGRRHELFVDHTRTTRGYATYDSGQLIGYTRIQYDAFGNLLDSNPFEIGFGGGLYDQEMELTYLTTRWYDPATARFTVLDSDAGELSDPRSFNRYMYALGDPVNRIDPLGQFSMQEVSQAVAIAGFLSASLAFAIAGTAPDVVLRGLSRGALNFQNDTGVTRPFLEGSLNLIGIKKGKTGRAGTFASASAGLSGVGGFEVLNLDGDLPQFFAYVGINLGASAGIGISTPREPSKQGDGGFGGAGGVGFRCAVGDVYDTFENGDYSGPFVGISGGIMGKLNLGRYARTYGRINVAAFSPPPFKNSQGKYSHTLTVFGGGVPLGTKGEASLSVSISGGFSITVYGPIRGPAFASFVNDAVADVCRIPVAVGNHT
ncbi:FG-GAP-like repeat-containing protein [Stieleria sp. JC731]|uniref:FG-GAP-like repeat-containing protein n=1 Tax=Pirellulaceae TaxID=2691357 RepID=UPI001E5AECB2|nr:FG-GAP-like repeat-containing protein [Stieleria sp. JC731]MCC9602193.1 FG-GAP-like repeat-containing protein [Stieleria sp. JC731]